MARKTKEELMAIDRDRKKAAYHTDLEQKEKQKARCLARYYRNKAARLAERASPSSAMPLAEAGGNVTQVEQPHPQV